MRKILPEIYQTIALIAVGTCFHPAAAVCPICTVATGIGLGFSRKLGIDDAITGIWIGGMIVSCIVWTTTFLTRHNIRFFGRKPLIVAAYLAAFIWPLKWYHYIGIHGNTLWGHDKLMVGMIVGGIAFSTGTLWYNILKKRNNGHAWFPFQKIVMPVGLLLIASCIMHYIVRINHG